MKSILLHIGDDDCLQARLQVSIDIARNFEAHLTCLQAVNLEIFAPGDFYGSAMASALPAIRKSAEELREKVEADLSNEDVVWDWLFEDGMPEHHLLAHSALKDVIVVGPHDIGQGGKHPSHMVGDLVVRSRTPVLVVPKDHQQLDCTAPAMVAWNGSAEACHALRAAIPLLQQADKVYLTSVGEEKQRQGMEFAPIDGAAYLSRHGVDCEILDLPGGEGRIAATLFTAAKLRACEYLVMGAYGHSRLSEMLLGGVTRQALKDPQLPIFLAH